MEHLSLCISYLSGDWTAAGFRKGAPSGLWQCAAPVEDFGSVASAFEESFTHTRADGRMVGMVLAHPRLSGQVIDVPPVKGWKLLRYLDRRVQQMKTFDGDAAWTHQRATPAKGAESVLVHLFPKAMLDQLTEGCAQAGGRLMRVLPSTAVLATQLRELPIDKEELALIAAETGDSTTVVIGKRDGRVCLARVLRGSWKTHADRVAVDLTRTIGFAEQQSGRTVNSVWLFGARVEERVAEIQKGVRPAVKPSPVEYTPLYWAAQALKLPAKEDGNLVALEVREAPQRRRFLTLTGASLLLMLFGSIGVAGYTQRLAQADQRTLAKMETEIKRWQTSKKEWQARHAESAHKREFVRLVVTEKPHPLPGWFLGYLGDATPPDVLLTALDVQRTNNAWTVRLAGTTQPPAKESPVILEQAVKELTNNLATGPFHVHLTRNSLTEPKLPGPESPASPPATAPLPNGAFQLEGLIR